MKPVSNTAFYCCGIRMWDAERKNPACGDIFAKKFMDDRGIHILEEFKSETRPNAANVARHRIIDDVLRDWLASDPALRVVSIGAGFDSRAYRLQGGVWVELDEPPLIAYKNLRLPVEECPNELHRIAIDFGADALESKLALYTKVDSVVIVIEGVFMYLKPEAVAALLRTLQRLFPRHRLICDLMTGRFFEKYSRPLHEKIERLGASFVFTVESPAEIFLDGGYRLVSSQSIVGRAAELGLLSTPRILIRLFARTAERGYQIYIFEYNSHAT